MAQEVPVIRFLHPFILNFLWLLLPLVLFLFMDLKRKTRLVASFPRREQIIPGFSAYRRTFKLFLVSGAMVALIIAAAGPQIGTRLEERTQKGVDIIIAIDVSQSMAAQDITPSRLDKARHATQSFIRKLRGDRVGLMPFAGEPYSLFPLTADYAAALMFVDILQVNFIPMPGTELAPVIRQATGMFDPESAAAKVLVILTDGEDFGKGIDTAVKEAKKAGVRIYTIGVGTPDGAPIPVLDSKGTTQTYKKDASGNIVLSRLNEGILADLARESGGKYYLVTSNESELTEIYDDIYKLEKGELTTRVFTDFEARYQWFLALALLLWGWNQLLPDTRRVKAGRNR